jgi:hypothetical protein
MTGAELKSRLLAALPHLAVNVRDDGTRVDISDGDLRVQLRVTATGVNFDFAIGDTLGGVAAHKALVILVAALALENTARSME